MGLSSFMRSVVDLNIVMWRTTVFPSLADHQATKIVSINLLAPELIF